jgi:hypothetical protein
MELVTEEHLREFTDRHLVLTLDESFSADEFIDVYNGVRKENPQSLPKLGRACSKADRLYAFVGGLLPVHKSAGEVLLWLVKKKHVKLRNLETFKVKYKGKSVECVAKRIITQYRPSEEKLQRHKRPQQTGAKVSCHSILSRAFKSNKNIKF